MKTIGMNGLWAMILLFAESKLEASTYFYPEKVRPAIVLPEACRVAEKLLASAVDADKYYAIDAMLSGTKEQDGKGIWYLRYSDQEGNKVDVYIPIPEGKVRLILFPDTKTEKEIQFQKSAKEILTELG